MNKDRLLSDEELAKKIMMEGYYNYRSNETFDSVLKSCADLINTQKRLYAESVKKELIDEIATMHSEQPYQNFRDWLYAKYIKEPRDE